MNTVLARRRDRAQWVMRRFVGLAAADVLVEERPVHRGLPDWPMDELLSADVDVVRAASMGISQTEWAHLERGLAIARQVGARWVNGPGVLLEEAVWVAGARLRLRVSHTNYATSMVASLGGARGEGRRLGNPCTDRLGMSIVLVDADGNAVLTRRSTLVARNPGGIASSASGAVEPADLLAPALPGPFAAALREIGEELGGTIRDSVRPETMRFLGLVRSSSVGQPVALLTAAVDATAKQIRSSARGARSGELATADPVILFPVREGPNRLTGPDAAQIRTELESASRSALMATMAIYRRAA